MLIIIVINVKKVRNITLDHRKQFASMCILDQDNESNLISLLNCCFQQNATKKRKKIRKCKFGVISLIGLE